MKVLMNILFIMVSLSIFSSEVDPKVERDLNLLKEAKVIGGAGNGGGEFALLFSRMVNLTARDIGIKNLKRFKKKYTVLVNNYNFCINSQNCEIAAKYFPKFKALLVNDTIFNSLTEANSRSTLIKIVHDIDNN